MSDGEEVSYQESDLEYIKASLRECLPALKDGQVERIATNMAKDGVTKDLAKFVEKTDMMSNGLDKYQARALELHWSSTTPAESADGGRPSVSTSQATGNDTHQNARSEEEDEEVQSFTLDWHAIQKVKRTFKGVTYSAEETLRQKKRPHPKLREAIVAEVVDQVRSKVAMPTRETFVPIHAVMVYMYPKSFQETLGKGTECSGGLLFQLKTRFDNTKRCDRNTHSVNPDDMKRQYEQPRGKFSYQCVRWRVQDFPDAVTDNSTKEIKEKLQKMHSEIRPECWNKVEIKDLMAKTYKAQRDLNNKNIEIALAEEKRKRARKRTHQEANTSGQESAEERVTVLMVFQEWPFLFTYDGLLQHFGELTQVDLEVQLTKFIEQETEAHIKFFQTLDDEFYVSTLKDMEKATRKHPDEAKENELRAIILMLVNYLSEESFIEIVEFTSTMETLEAKKVAPVYPGLKVPAKHNNIFKAKRFFYGTDCELYCCLNTFKEAFCCVYVVYYVFNLNYAPKQQVALEYVQRCIFHMDPVKGNKRPPRPTRGEATSGVYSTKVVHPHVSQLHKKVRKLMAAGSAATDEEDNPDSEESSEDDVD